MFHLIAKLLGKEHFLHRSQQRLMEYKGNKVLSFRDYSSEVMAQRRGFHDTMQTFWSRGIKHTLQYPAKLHVYLRDDEPLRIFLNAKEAVGFDTIRYGLLSA